MREEERDQCEREKEREQKADRFRVDAQGQEEERREGTSVIISALHFTVCPLSTNTRKFSHILQARNKRLALILNLAFTLMSVITNQKWKDRN